MVACAGACLNVPPHVEFNLFAAYASARRHHRISHAIAAGAIHSRVTLIQVTSTGVVVPEPAGAPGIRGVTHPGLRTFLVAQSRLGPMECRGYILKENGKLFYNKLHCARISGWQLVVNVTDCIAVFFFHQISSNKFFF